MAQMLAGDDRRNSQDFYRRRSVRAMMWFVREYLATPREPFDTEGDVILFNGQTVDVKCVTAGLPSITGHATHPPRSLSVIVEASGVAVDAEGIVEEFVHVGTVLPNQWRWDTPPYRNGQACWMILKDEMMPPLPKTNATKRSFQIQAFVPEEIQQPDETSLLDDPTGVRELTPKELKYRRDKAADQRRRGRVKASKGTGLFFPDDTPRGLGVTRGGKKPVKHDD